MRLTGRGWGVLIAIVVAVLMGAQYGSRSLNAIVVPLAVVGVAAAVTVSRADRPDVERLPIEAGHVGEYRTVAFVLSSGRGTTATVIDRVGDGLTADANRFELTIAGETRVEHPVRLDARGERTVGPTTVIVRDLLGLLERRFECEATEPVVVYPPVYELRTDARRDLASFANTAREFERAEFDHLREYERGDSLRDVHWKSAAKRSDDELIVKEFVADEGLDRVSLVAECRPGDADEMAAAAATLVDHLLDLDVGVVLAVPYDRTAEGGPDRRDALFRATATADEGTAGSHHREEADVVIRADADGVVVDFGDRTVPFAELCVYEDGDAGDSEAVGPRAGAGSDGRLGGVRA
ncbi:DUF58 domain-containing protein [Halovivax sp.]|uniref:DUF58 domain-containing protein n=1 Tax=Halovivax sp. TaxID=1935978 RepID=UPI0025C22FC0|nr:DUF58 domain-containing protein [Halovivax sp.]